MMCQRIGRPPSSTSGLGRNSVSSRSRVPRPPHRITTFMSRPFAGLFQTKLPKRTGREDGNGQFIQALAGQLFQSLVNGRGQGTKLGLQLFSQDCVPSQADALLTAALLDLVEPVLDHR